MTTLNKKISNYSLENSRLKLKEILDLIDELKELEPAICNPPGDGLIKKDTQIQSGIIYLQAAGSDESDGIVEGIHLRWSLTGSMTDKHIPKGNLANVGTSHYANFGFIKNDDYVAIHRTPYVDLVPAILDLNTLVPTGIKQINGINTWSFSINNTHTVNGNNKTINNVVVLRFLDTAAYNAVPPSINPSTNPKDFIANYNSEIHLEVENKLFFAVEVELDGASIELKSETVYVSDLSTEANRKITSRKTFISSPSNQSQKIEGENIKTLRFKVVGGGIDKIKIETYQDFLTTRDSWTKVDDFGLTDDENIAYSRLESAGKTVHNSWPRFKSEIKTKKSNYENKWSNDGGLEDAVNQYLTLSKTDIYATRVLEADLPEESGANYEDNSKFEIKYSEALNLASLDYHVARMLGLGHIDQFDYESSRHVYIAIYNTNPGWESDRNIAGYDHLYMALPTGLTDTRIPVIPKAPLIQYGFPNLEPCTATDICDEDGYAKYDSVRFINITRQKYDDEIAFQNFFESNIEFDITQIAAPIFYGIEYKKSGQSWEIQEIAATSDEFTDLATVGEVNECIPLIPDRNESLFTHMENDNGVHEYALYAINWFSRATTKSASTATDETTVKDLSLIKTPDNIELAYIQEEEERLFSTEAEQIELEARNAANPTGDNYWARVNFNWHHLHKLSYQTANKLEFYFRENEALECQGRIKTVQENSNTHTAIVTVESFQIISGKSIETITPTILSTDKSKFIGALLITPNGNFRIKDLTISQSVPTFTVYQNTERRNYIDSVTKETKAHCVYINPEVGKNFNVYENLQLPAAWQKLESSSEISLVDFGNREETITNEDGSLSTYIVGGIEGTATVTYEGTSQNMQGLYKVAFNSEVLSDHPEKGTKNVNWYKGIVRIPNNQTPAKYKALDVIKLESQNPLVVWAYDPEYDANVPLTTGTNVDANFHPGYRLYLKPETGSGRLFNKQTIIPQSPEFKKVTYLSVKAVDSSTNKSSEFSSPIPLLGIRNIKPKKQSKPVGPVFATRPDSYGKSTYTSDLQIGEQAPYALMYLRTNEFNILDSLYTDEKMSEIYESIKNLESNTKETERFADLINLNFDTETGHTEEFKEYDGYRLPIPNKIDFTNNETWEQKKAIWKVFIEKSFVPITEQPIVYEFIKSDGTPTENKKPVLRDSNNNLFNPGDTNFNPYPNVRKYSANGDDFVRITDYQLDGASKNYYFYSVREISNKLEMGELSEILGPVFLVNTTPADAPYIRKTETILAEPYLGIKPGIRFEINPYFESEDVRKVAIYRTLDVDKSKSIELMDLAVIVDIDSPIVDDFPGENVIVPFGDEIYYRLVAMREILNEKREIEYIPGHPSDTTTGRVVANINPEAPEINYTIGAVITTPTPLLQGVILTWNPTTYKGKYYLYKMSDMGMWQLVQEFSSSQPMSYSYPILDKEDDDGDTIYHRFKVVAENRSGLLSLEENITTI